jgi:glycosyltransferase involved in cell wall biosynthesis
MAEMLKSNIAISLYDGRLYYQPAVPQDELQYYTFDADVGVVPIPDNCMSHHLSLPNKLFEFIQGGLAVVASDLPEISRVINEYNVGQTYEAGNIVAFSERIKTILRNVELLATYRNNSDKAAKVLNWQNEQQILLQIYNS